MNSIELYGKINDPFAAIKQAGEMMAKSGMFGCDKSEQGMILAWACFSEGKSPFEIKRTYHLMNGELSMRSDAMLALFRERGGKHKIVSRTADLSAVELIMDGQSNTFSFSWEDALKEPFVKDKNGNIKRNYATPRARMQMLWARAISDGVHAMAPEIVSGTYTPEEIEDFAPSTEPKPLLEKKKPSNVIEIKTELTEPQPVEKVEGETPVENAPTPQATPFQAELNKETGRLTIETEKAIISAIGEHVDTAIAWFKSDSKKWLKHDEGISSLSVQRAQKILNKPAEFLSAIGVK